MTADKHKLPPFVGDDVARGHAVTDAPGKMSGYQDFVQLNTLLEKWRVKTCGVEIGNWYGFAGIPMKRGLASFAELSLINHTESDFDFVSHVRMYRLDVKIAYSLSVDHDTMIAETTIESLADSLLGDAVLHLTFAPGNALPRFNEIHMEKRDRYYYSLQQNSCIELRDDVRLMIETEMDGLPDRMDLELAPYAAYLSDGRIRYHTRALCLGGDNSSLLLRTRGTLGCISLGKCPASMRRWLYRIERQAPRLLSNTQLCAVTTFPKGAKLRLSHRIVKK